MESINIFCFLKGLVDCNSGRIQDCNVKHVNICTKEIEKAKDMQKQQAFCYLKGLVDCTPSDVQDCNMKRVNKCPLDKQ